ncbi:MAG: PqqD family protein [Clostridiales bacterium]|nr:PqqD family protein [Clostridiales bacterium]
MKINEDYIMRNIAGEVIVVPTGVAAGNMNGLITLNDVAAFLWKNLQEDRTVEELEALVLEEYDVDEETAKRDVKGFTDALFQCGMLVE